MSNPEGLTDFTVKYNGRGAIFELTVDKTDNLRALTGLIAGVVGGKEQNAVGTWTKVGASSERFFISVFANTDEDCDEIAGRLRKAVPSLAHIEWRPTTPDETKDTMFILAAMATDPRARTVPDWRKK